jgi:uncharacterized peroxidase-related enzyme
MTRIKVIDYEESSGRLREIYDDLITKRGKLAEVHKIQSLRPESILKHIDLYLEIMFSHSELSRAEREMMAVVVSTANGCIYCQAHHSQALNFYWKNDKKIELLNISYTKANLDDKNLILCKFADELTRNPENAHLYDITDPLNKIGLSNNAVLDATLVVAYFNFVNRIVLALGVELENDSGKNYKY